MSSLKAIKFKITSPEHSAAVQSKLFEMGYAWCGYIKEAKYTDAKYLFAGTFGGNEITYEINDAAYFKEHATEEYVLTTWGAIMSAKDYFKQPATAPTFKDRLTAAVVQKKGETDTMFVPIPYPVVTDEQIIANQKAVADKILDKLFPLDPFAICAGGAPRDWHFGKPATDLDIFFYTSVEQITIVAEMLRHVGINLVDEGRTGDELPEWYKLNPALRCVYSTVVDGVNVQLMLMNDKTHNSVIPHFPFSICKAWYKHGRINLDKDFLAAEQNKVVVKCNTVYNDEHKYVQKIKAKFPDWQFCESWEEAYKHAFYNKGK